LIILDENRLGPIPGRQFSGHEESLTP
jgi:hypothetical protein